MLRVGALLASVDRPFHSFTSRCEKHLCPFTEEFFGILRSVDVLCRVHAFFYKQLLYKQGSTRQGKKLCNFSTGLKTAKQFEKLYFQYLKGNVN